MKQNKFFRTFSSVTGVILLGKLMGFVKQMVTAGTFGATIETDLINLAEGFIGNIQYVLVQVLLTAFTATYIHIWEQDAFESETLQPIQKVFDSQGLLYDVYLPPQLLEEVTAEYETLLENVQVNLIAAETAVDLIQEYGRTGYTEQRCGYCLCKPPVTGGAIR